MEEISYQSYDSPFGELFLASFKNKLCSSDWSNRKNKEQIKKRLSKGLNAEFIEKESKVILKAKKQLDEYFKQKRKFFSVPLLMAGTTFQEQVWTQLLKIPYGQTTSYLELAEALDKIKAVRAVANANGANALSIFIPCHRVIGKNNSLTGYAGGLKAKEKLLILENNLFTFH